MLSSMPAAMFCDLSANNNSQLQCKGTQTCGTQGYSTKNVDIALGARCVPSHSRFASFTLWWPWRMVEEGWCRDGVAASICVATTSLRLITHGQKQEETANPPGGCNASNHAISFDKAAEPMHSKTYVCVSAIGEDGWRKQVSRSCVQFAITMLPG